MNNKPCPKCGIPINAGFVACAHEGGCPIQYTANEPITELGKSLLSVWMDHCSEDATSGDDTLMADLDDGWMLFEAIQRVEETEEIARQKIIIHQLRTQVERQKMMLIENDNLIDGYIDRLNGENSK